MTAVLLTPPYLQFFDANGNPLAGGSVTTYAAGTTMQQATYTDSTGATPLSNPIALDSAGRPIGANGSIWINGSYKFIVKDSLGNIIETTDGVSSFGTSAGGQIYNSQTIATNNTGGFINKFRNPGMGIGQRVLSGTITAGAGATPIFDGWTLLATGANITWSQGLPINSGTGPASLIINGATSNSDIQLKQRIESSDSACLLSSQVTFQATILNNSGQTIIPVLSTNICTVKDNWASSTQDLAPINLQTIATGSQVTVSYSFFVGGNAYLGYQVLLDLGAVTQIGNIFISGLDIRVTPAIATGLISMPPVPEVPQISLEWPRAKRYLDGFGESTGVVGLAVATSTTAFGVYIPFKNKMRIAPTGITVTTVADLEISSFAGSDIAALTGLSFGNASEDGIFLTGTVASGLTSGVTYQLRVKTALAGNVIFTGAEL